MLAPKFKGPGNPLAILAAANHYGGWITSEMKETVYEGRVPKGYYELFILADKLF